MCLVFPPLMTFCFRSFTNKTISFIEIAVDLLLQAFHHHSKKCIIKLYERRFSWVEMQENG